jgi:uncharacterized membrane protein
MSADPPPDDLTPAERRVREYLSALRLDEVAGPTSLSGAVVRTARWQRAVRTPLHAAGMLAAALADGVRLVLGAQAQRGEER